MGHLLGAIFLRHIVEHLIAAVVIEVDVDIGKRDTVGVEETLEQQIVFDRVDLRDAETIGGGRTGGRTTSRADAHSELVAPGIDEVLHDQKVAGEAHRLHDVELELQPLIDVGRNRISVTFLRAVVGELGEIIGLELDAVKLVVAPESFDFLYRLLFGKHDIPVLVLGELVEELLFRDP